MSQAGDLAELDRFNLLRKDHGPLLIPMQPGEPSIVLSDAMYARHCLRRGVILAAVAARAFRQYSAATERGLHDEVPIPGWFDLVRAMDELLRMSPAQIRRVIADSGLQVPIPNIDSW